MNSKVSSYLNCLFLNSFVIFLEINLMAFHPLRPERVTKEKPVPVPYVIIFSPCYFKKKDI